jgi:hypothetical protein
MMGGEREECVPRRPADEQNGARMTPAAVGTPCDSEIAGTQLAEAFMSPLVQVRTDPAELPSFRPLSRTAVSRNAAEQGHPAQRTATEIRRTAAPHQLSETEKQIERVQSSVSPLLEAAVPNDRQRHSSRFRGAMLAGIFVLGVSGGIGGVYLMHIPKIDGASYMQHAQRALSFAESVLGWEYARTDHRRDQARSVAELVTSEPNPIAEGGAVTAGQGSATSIKSKSSYDAADGSSRHVSLPSLAEQVARQITVGQLEAPAEDNALETYRRMVAVSAQHPGTVLAGERLSAAFWSRAMDAKKTQHWDDALHYLDILDTLPLLPAAAISMEAAIVPGGLALGGSVPQRGMLGSTETGPPGPPKELPNPALQSGAAQQGSSTNGDRAAATSSSIGNASQLGSLAKDRGDAAIRLGDVVAARQFYQLAASDGIAGAARAIALTYDPVYLQGLGVRGLKGDPDLAKRWYEKAVAEGDTEARIRLSRLQNALTEARR